jgi:hypothetical protein
MLRKACFLVLLAIMVAPVSAFAQTNVLYYSDNGPGQYSQVIETVNNLEAVSVESAMDLSDVQSMGVPTSLIVEVDLNNNGTVDYSWTVNNPTQLYYRDSYNFPTFMNCTSVRISHHWNGTGTGVIHFRTLVEFQ